MGRRTAKDRDVDLEFIQRQIRRGLKNKMLSAAAASKLACGNPNLIKNIMNGHMPRLDSLRKLGPVLGIDFHLGADDPVSRRTGPEDTSNEALEQVLKALPREELAKIMGGDMEAATLFKLVLSLDPGDREKCEALMRALADARANEKVKDGKKKSG